MQSSVPCVDPLGATSRRSRAATGDQEGVNVMQCSQGGGFMDDRGCMDEGTWGRGCGGRGGTDGDVLVTFALLVVAALTKVAPYCSSAVRLAPGLAGGIGLLLQLWSAP